MKTQGVRRAEQVRRRVNASRNGLDVGIRVLAHEPYVRRTVMSRHPHDSAYALTRPEVRIHEMKRVRLNEPVLVSFEIVLNGRKLERLNRFVRQPVRRLDDCVPQRLHSGDLQRDASRFRDESDTRKPGNLYFGSQVHVKLSY